MTRFDGKTAIITGATGNLGRAVARRLAVDGARLAVIDIDKKSLEVLAEDLPGAHVSLALDLLDPAAVDTAVTDIASKFGGIDMLCALAGGFDMGPAVHESGPELWRKMQDLNVGTLLPMLGAVVPLMLARKSGKIVTVGANAAHHGMASMGAYCAAKSSVMRITESTSAELRGESINVNAVLPSILDTPENRAAMPDADPSNWVAPEKLAGVIAFLVSPDSDPVHGVLLPVTGLS